MSKSQSNNHSSSIGFTGLLAIVFITLKLTGFINWSWWWVTAPIWGPLALVAILAMIAGLIAIFSD